MGQEATPPRSTFTCMGTEEVMAERAQILRALLPNGISDSLTQRELDSTMLEVMREAKLPLEYAYAYMKTKRLVTEENAQYLSDEELEEWNLAVEDDLANPDPGRIPKPGDWWFWKISRQLVSTAMDLRARGGGSGMSWGDEFGHLGQLTADWRLTTDPLPRAANAAAPVPVVVSVRRVWQRRSNERAASRASVQSHTPLANGRSRGASVDDANSSPASFRSPKPL